MRNIASSFIDLAKFDDIAHLNMSAEPADVALYQSVSCGRATLIEPTSSHTYRISDENTVSFHGSGDRITRCDCWLCAGPGQRAGRIDSPLQGRHVLFGRLEKGRLRGS
jgi:hypothetical protein